jgi:hypothetical protein
MRLKAGVTLEDRILEGSVAYPWRPPRFRGEKVEGPTGHLIEPQRDAPVWMPRIQEWTWSLNSPVEDRDLAAGPHTFKDLRKKLAWTNKDLPKWCYVTWANDIAGYSVLDISKLLFGDLPEPLSDHEDPKAVKAARYMLGRGRQHYASLGVLPWAAFPAGKPGLNWVEAPEFRDGFSAFCDQLRTEAADAPALVG